MLKVEEYQENHRRIKKSDPYETGLTFSLQSSVFSLTTRYGFNLQPHAYSRRFVRFVGVALQGSSGQG